MTNESAGKNRVIQSVQRALDIIDCFNSQKVELSLNELSLMLDLNKSTVHGLVNTLVVNDYISQNNQNGKYYLGRRLISKGILASSALQYDLKEIGSKFLRILSEKYKVTSHLFICRSGILTFIDMAVPTSAYYVVSSVIGRNMPLNATASGKIMLANMDPVELEFWIKNNELVSFTENTITEESTLLDQVSRIREAGYSVEDEEVELGLFSIAFPIRKPDGQLFGTISITGSAQKVRNELKAILEDLSNVRNNIEDKLFSDHAIK